MGERGDVKAEEVRKACRILGFDNVFFLNVDAAVLVVDADVIRTLARLFRELRPNIILTHFPFEHGGLGDHAVTGQMVVRAIDYAASVDPGDRRPPVRVEQVFFFGQGGASVRNGLWDAAGGYTNDVFIDTTDVIDKKFAAMECLVSQGYAGAYNRKRTENGDGAFGGGTAAYGEGYIRMNAEVHYLLPLTSYARRRTGDSDHEIMGRYSWRLPMPVSDSLEIAAGVDPDGVLRALGRQSPRSPRSLPRTSLRRLRLPRPQRPAARPRSTFPGRAVVDGSCRSARPGGRAARAGRPVRRPLNGGGANAAAGGHAGR